MMKKLNEDTILNNNLKTRNINQHVSHKLLAAKNKNSLVGNKTPKKKLFIYKGN